MAKFTGVGIGESTNYKIGERDDIMKSVDSFILSEIRGIFPEYQSKGIHIEDVLDPAVITSIGLQLCNLEAENDFTPINLLQNLEKIIGHEKFARTLEALPKECTDFIDAEPIISRHPAAIYQTILTLLRMITKSYIPPGAVVEVITSYSDTRQEIKTKHALTPQEVTAIQHGQIQEEYDEYMHQNFALFRTMMDKYIKDKMDIYKVMPYNQIPATSDYQTICEDGRVPLEILMKYADCFACGFELNKEVTLKTDKVFENYAQIICMLRKLDADNAATYNLRIAQGKITEDDRNRIIFFMKSIGV